MRFIRFLLKVHSERFAVRYGGLANQNFPAASSLMQVVRYYFERRQPDSGLIHFLELSLILGRYVLNLLVIYCQPFAVRDQRWPIEIAAGDHGPVGRNVLS